MKKALAIYFIFLSFAMFSKTAEEYNKEAEAYSEKSKQSFILAGVAFAFFIAVRYINKKLK